MQEKAGESLKALQCPLAYCSAQYIEVLLCSPRETCSDQAVPVVPWGCTDLGKALQYLGLPQDGCSDSSADHLC